MLKVEARTNIRLRVPRLFPTPHPKVVVAIPCFNTELYIGEVVRKARKYVDEVIVINDGSHDATAEAARAAGAMVINHGTNRGYGGAIISCFEAAKAQSADVLVTLDGDGQHEAGEVPKILAPILSGEADLVIGSRFLASEVAMPAYRRFGIGVITWLFNLGSRTRVSDSQSGFRAYRSGVFGDVLLSESGMGISIETLEKARRKHATIKEVPVTCQYTRGNGSHLNTRAVRHGLGVALDVVRIRLKSILRLT